MTAQDYLNELYEEYGTTRFNGDRERWYKLEGVDALEIDQLESMTGYSDGFRLNDCVWQEEVERVGDTPEYCVVRLKRDR